jgi:hypothetical protein
LIVRQLSIRNNCAFIFYAFYPSCSAVNRAIAAGCADDSRAVRLIVNINSFIWMAAWKRSTVRVSAAIIPCRDLRGRWENEEKNDSYNH